MIKIKYFDELTIAKIINKINDISAFDYIYYIEEKLDNINVPRKIYKAKFLDEEDEILIHLTDIPFNITNREADYLVLYETTSGFFYQHENSKLNIVRLDTDYESIDEFKKSYETRLSKRINQID